MNAWPSHLLMQQRNLLSAWWGWFLQGHRLSLGSDVVEQLLILALDSTPWDKNDFDPTVNAQWSSARIRHKHVEWVTKWHANRMPKCKGDPLVGRRVRLGGLNCPWKIWHSKMAFQNSPKNLSKTVKNFQLHIMSKNFQHTRREMSEAECRFNSFGINFLTANRTKCKKKATRKCGFVTKLQTRTPSPADFEFFGEWAWESEFVGFCFSQWSRDVTVKSTRVMWRMLTGDWWTLLNLVFVQNWPSHYAQGTAEYIPK